MCMSLHSLCQRPCARHFSMLNNIEFTSLGNVVMYVAHTAWAIYKEHVACDRQSILHPMNDVLRTGKASNDDEDS
jgi:hypothetical protein